MTKRIFGYNILTCMITIGSPGVGDPSVNDVKYIINEVANIEIQDSYETLINKCTITLPRQTIMEASEYDKDDLRLNLLIGNPKINPIFEKGQRVTVWLGYDDDGTNNFNKKMFDGFIVSVESGNPYVLHCEDMGYMLKKNMVQPYSSPLSGCKLNDIAPMLLNGTGLKLHPLTIKSNIQLGRVSFGQSMSAADILGYWKKQGLMSFIKFYNGVPHLAVSRSFFGTNEDEQVIINESDEIPLIDFSENVASDELKVMNLDYDAIALKAISVMPDNSTLSLFIIKDPSDYSKFKIVNEAKLSKKQYKKTNAVDIDDFIENYKNSSNKQEKFDLTAYNVRTYHVHNVDRETLIKGAESEFNKICLTGVEGNIVVFGDYGLRSGSMVKLLDVRNPERNGVYVLSDVKTTFGTGGYRQTLKIPHKRCELNEIR
ncbi:MAG: hypothetical protein ACRDD8_15475 [Bacteroidales bacterium]